tara:strand:+ start:316543 stop:317301 length:759 start_codon:yes stop_codon:yes gene_type:complete
MNSMNEIRSVPNSTQEDRSCELCVNSCKTCISRQVSICSVLEDNEIHLVSSISKINLKPAKQVICNEGETANYLYNINHGCVRISKTLPDGRRQIIGFLFPGEFFGLARDNGYDYSAEFITNVELCQMPINKIFAMFSKFPKLGHKMLEITRTELQITQDQMLLLGRKTAKEKLCSFLIAMQQKSKQLKDIKENHVYLPMSRSDIADHLGLTIETVSRQFTILGKDGIISLGENPFVEILDRKHLKLIASGE